MNNATDCSCKKCNRAACACSAEGKNGCHCSPECGCEKPCKCNGCGCCNEKK